MANGDVKTHRTVFGGVRIECAALGSAALEPDFCRNVWRDIPEGDQINEGIIEALRVRFNDLTEPEIAILRDWPKAQLRFVRRSVVEFFQEGDPVLVDVVTAVHPEPPGAAVVVHDLRNSDGSTYRRVTVTLSHPQWSRTRP